MKTKTQLLFYCVLSSFTLFGQEISLDTTPLAFPLEEEYQTNGAAFATRKISPCKVYIDLTSTASIEDIVTQQGNLNWQDPSQIPQEVGKVYWVKTRLYGSVGFNGEKILHVSNSASENIFSFDYVDSYSTDGQGGFNHQRTGDKVPLKERPFNHWAHFINLNIEANDTVDLFVRLEGADARYLSPNGRLAVYQVDRLSLFPSQSNISFTGGLFYGVLAIQGIFFLLLFLISSSA